MLPHFPMLYKTAYRLVQNREDAEDLVQETYAKAFRSLDQFEEGTNSRNWLFKILKNVFYDFVRKQKRQRNMHEKVSQEEETSLFSKEEMFNTLYAEEREVLETLSFLPEEYRMTLTLYYVDDCTYAEIAEIMECPIGTVRSRLSRGKQFLKKKFILRQSRT